MLAQFRARIIWLMEAQSRNVCLIQNKVCWYQIWASIEFDVRKFLLISALLFCLIIALSWIYFDLPLSLLNQCSICIQSNIWLFILYVTWYIQSSSISSFDYKLTLASELIFANSTVICFAMNKLCDYMIISENSHKQWCWLSELIKI